MGRTLMAIKTFYFKDAAASGSSHGSLQDGGSAPTAATTGTGWAVGKNDSPNYALQVYGSKVSAPSFSATDTLNTQTNAGTTASWRSESTLDGVFANTSWTITGLYRAATAGGQNGRLNVKLFKSPNANGTANVTVVELSGGSKLTGSNTGAITSTTTDYTSAVTFTPTSPVQFYNEFVFVTCQWEPTVASNSNSSDVLWRVGSTANVVTSDFTVRNKTAVTT